MQTGLVLDTWCSDSRKPFGVAGRHLRTQPGLGEKRGHEEAGNGRMNKEARRCVDCTEVWTNWFGARPTGLKSWVPSSPLRPDFM